MNTLDGYSIGCFHYSSYWHVWSFIIGFVSNGNEFMDMVSETTVYPPKEIDCRIREHCTPLSFNRICTNPECNCNDHIRTIDTLPIDFDAKEAIVHYLVHILNIPATSIANYDLYLQQMNEVYDIRRRARDMVDYGG
jgi:hypothetical protein